jgi:hypothetical protein
MADDTSHLARTLEDFKRDLAVKVAEARNLLQTINMLEEKIGASRTSLGDLGQEPGNHQAGGPIPAQNFTAPPKRVSALNLRPDEYLGEEPLEAAKRYLGSVGHAVHFDEIAEAVQKGGAAIRGADWRERLETSLFRSATQVVKVQEKTYGLVSFYTDEQIARLRGSRRRIEPKKKKANANKKAKRTQNRKVAKPKTVEKTVEKKADNKAASATKAQPPAKKAAASVDEPKKAEAGESIH